MTKLFSFIAFILGAFVVLWMGSSFIHSNALALLVTVLIAAAYTAGFAELLRYQRATDSLEQALNAAHQPVADLSAWLGKLHPSLRFAVRQRIYGESTGLPAPLLTPYLVGLLVMLGLLGTFIGMVETLQGAVGALQGSTELEAVRDGLAAPIQGLGMAFATSVAGVTASAMLGLISTLSRKQRLQASRQLDSEMAGAFKQHSLSYQRRQTYEVLQAQSAALPAVAEQLGLFAKQLDERMHALADQLSSSQQGLHETLSGQYRQLSQSVEAALSEGFRDSGRLAAESAQPILRTFTETLASESKQTQQHMSTAIEQQLAGINEQLGRNSDTLQRSWQTAQQTQEQAAEHLLIKIGDQVNAAQLKLSQASADLAERNREAAAATHRDIETLVSRSEALLEAQQQREQSWQTEATGRLQELIAAASTQLQALRSDEQARGEAAIQRLAELQETSSRQLAALGDALEQPMSRLIETASEAPRAAAEVIEQMRGEISKNIERDNSLLEERQHTLGQLTALSASLEENARLQREAVQALLEGSAEHLQSVGRDFEEKISTESSGLSEQISHFTASAAELSALGDVFSSAVQHFGDANAQLITRLEQIESVLVNAGQRSDEQMEYYLSQAREIIDHNLMGQQELLGHLRQHDGQKNGQQA